MIQVLQDSFIYAYISLSGYVFQLALLVTLLRTHTAIVLQLHVSNSVEINITSGTDALLLLPVILYYVCSPSAHDNVFHLARKLSKYLQFELKNLRYEYGPPSWPEDFSSRLLVIFSSSQLCCLTVIIVFCFEMNL